jgi:pilus assembly protein CpaF
VAAGLALEYGCTYTGEGVSRVQQSGRFSVLDYSRDTASAGPLGEMAQNQNGADEEFDRCVEEVRTYLVTAGGTSEGERALYCEALNKAVLGYSEERERFLAIIGDYIAKRRWNRVRSRTGAGLPLAEAIFAEVIGLNTLEFILKQRAGLEEIQVVGTRIYEVRNGVSVPSEYSFRSVKEVERLQQNLVLFNNDRITPRKRWAEVTMIDGTRVTMTGFGFTAIPTLTMRFYAAAHFKLHQLCDPAYATLDEKICTLLLAVLKARLNLVIIGPTNSGKTHLLKSLIAELPDHERLVTIESRFELALGKDFPSKNVIEYEITEDDELHNGAQAFKLALRQSPERICHAEIRDEDANMYVRACTRGHEGSMTTVHCNELEDVPDTIADMCMLDGRQMNAVRLTRRIASYVTQIGVQMAIVSGRRKVVRMGQFVLDQERIMIRELVRYNEDEHCWEFPEPLDAFYSERVRRGSPERYGALKDWGLVQ